MNTENCLHRHLIAINYKNKNVILLMMKRKMGQVRRELVRAKMPGHNIVISLRIYYCFFIVYEEMKCWANFLNIVGTHYENR